MADVSTHATLPTSLVGYWELGESSGTRVDSKSTRDLTDNNTVLNAVGKWGNAADFEQTNSEYLGRASSGLVGFTSISVQAWVYMESASATYPQIAGAWRDSINNRGWTLCLVSGNPYFYVTELGTNASTKNVTSGIALSTGVWYHLVGTFDGSTGDIALYVNNTAYTSTSALTGTYSSTAEFRIGHNEWFGNRGDGYWDGLIDEVGVWSKKLSASEVSDLYNGGAGLPYVETVSAKRYLGMFALVEKA